MRIVFFGTPQFVVPILDLLHKEFKDKKTGESPIVAVVTQEPKQVGREKFLTYSPVDKWAHERRIEIIHNFSEPLPEADLGICAAYGKIIPEDVIKSFPNGILNIHPSLLPKYRGASPIQYTLKNGDKETGVTIIKMDEKMDHGPIVAQFKEEVLPDDTAEKLKFRLFERSAPVLVELLEAYLKGRIKLKPQDEALASFTNMLSKQDGFIEFEKLIDPTLSVQNYNLVRAMDFWPGVWTIVKNKRLKILKTHMDGETLVIDEVQLEGKNPVSWKQFCGAYQIII